MADTPQNFFTAAADAWETAGKNRESMLEGYLVKNDSFEAPDDSIFLKVLKHDEMISLVGITAGIVGVCLGMLERVSGNPTVVSDLLMIGGGFTTVTLGIKYGLERLMIANHKEM